MALDIAVTGDALLGYIITLTDADAEDVINVYRVDQTGHYSNTRVRELDMATPSGSTMIVIDYEAPFNVDLKYVAESYDSGDLETVVATDTSGIVGTTLPFGFAIITDPLDQTQRVAIGVETLDEWGYSAKVLGTHNVLGRRNAVINMDVESGREGSIAGTNLDQFGVDWDDTGPYLPYRAVGHANWETIFRSGRTLQFRNTWDESGFDDMYFKVKSHKTQRLEKVGVSRGDVFKRFTIDYIEQDQPSTSISGLALGTWQQVFDSNADWTEVNSDHSTWASVLTNPRL